MTKKNILQLIYQIYIEVIHEEKLYTDWLKEQLDITYQKQIY